MNMYGFYQHIDGGLYLLREIITDADTGEDRALYDHVWPFARGTYTRLMKDWNLRFRKIDYLVYADATLLSRDDCQRNVVFTKRIRKYSEALVTRNREEKTPEEKYLDWWNNLEFRHKQMYLRRGIDPWKMG